MTKENNDKQLIIKITPEQHKMIKLKAVQRGISIKALVLMAIKKMNGGKNETTG